MRVGGAMFLAVISFCAGCGGGGGGGSGGGSAAPAAPVTILVENTDCPVKDIMISPFTVEQDNSGGLLSLKIKATVTCMGTPLNGVKLTFTIPGAASPITATTDANGNASISPGTPDNKDVIGQSVDVSVTGVDGTTYPKPPPATVTKAP